jgi:CBS domain-containing protein
MKTNISVRDAMTTKVITISPEESVANAAKLMKKHNIGGLVVSENSNPVGMLTERDLLDIAANDDKPSEVLVKKAMSTPLITISQDASIMDAAKLMAKSKTRKLPVKEKEDLIGIITAEDIVKIAPQEVELLLELAALKVQGEEFMQGSSSGECESCGNYSERLYPVGGASICNECKEAQEA